MYNKVNMNYYSEEGIAVVIALVTVLLTSIMAVSISFVSNTDYKTMSNFKSGQESFLAAERCTIEARKRLEIEGVETIVALQTIEQVEGFNMTLSNNSFCRTGQRTYDSANDDLPFVNLPKGVKSIDRPIKHTSLPSGGESGPVAAALDFEVVGKHSGDRDKDDTNLDINTGTQISVGIETFLPGGGSNVY